MARRWGERGRFIGQDGHSPRTSQSATLGPRQYTLRHCYHTAQAPHQHADIITQSSCFLIQHLSRTHSLQNGSSNYPTRILKELAPDRDTHCLHHNMKGPYSSQRRVEKFQTQRDRHEWTRLRNQTRLAHTGPRPGMFSLPSYRMAWRYDLRSNQYCFGMNGSHREHNRSGNNRMQQVEVEPAFIERSVNSFVSRTPYASDMLQRPQQTLLPNSLDKTCLTPNI